MDSEVDEILRVEMVGDVREGVGWALLNWRSSWTRVVPRTEPDLVRDRNLADVDGSGAVLRWGFEYGAMEGCDNSGCSRSTGKSQGKSEKLSRKPRRWVVSEAENKSEDDRSYTKSKESVGELVIVIDSDQN